MSDRANTIMFREIVKEESGGGQDRPENENVNHTLKLLLLLYQVEAETWISYLQYSMSIAS